MSSFNIQRQKTESDILNRGKIAYQEQKKKNLIKFDDDEFDKI